MAHLWLQLQQAVSIIVHGRDSVVSAMTLTLHVSAIAGAAAAVIGLPVGLTIGLGRFRGRAVLHVFANASLGFPPVLLGLILYLVCDPPGPLGPLLRLSDANHLTSTLCICQTILALPYVVALSAAAVQQLGSELPAQARLLGAGRLQVTALAMREAWVGIAVALIAGLAATLTEVGAQAVLTGLDPGSATLAGSVLFQADTVNTPAALACAIVLLAIVVVLLGTISFLQHSASGRRGLRPAGAIGPITQPA
jgi:tungstate transport system permease protein